MRLRSAMGLMLFLTPGPVWAEDAVVVSLRPAARVEGSTVMLPAVADVSGGDARLRAEITRLDVAEVRRGERSVTVPRVQVALRIRLAGIDPERFRVEGVERCEVTLEASPLTEARLIATARLALLERFPESARDIEARPAAPVKVPPLAAGLPPEDVRLDAEVRAAKLAPGPVRVDVSIHAGGKRVATVPVALQVQLFREAAVALRRIEKGEAVTEEMFRRERRPGTGSEVPPPVEVAGRRAVRAIAAGQVIGAEDLDGPAAPDAVLVRPRDAVRLVARVGAGWVTAAGEALQEGRLGQSVRVRNVGSGKVVSGRVSGRGAVEVDY